MPVESDTPAAAHGEDPNGSPVCPFLAAADSAWLAATASADHRCHALQPPAPLAILKQRRLCLVAEHRTCATFQAAHDVRASRLGSQADMPSPWGWARTTPVVDTSNGPFAAIAAFLTDRRGWQIVPAVALVAALGALGLSNIGADRGQGGTSPPSSFVAVASPTPSGSATALVTPSPVPPTPVPSASVAAGPTVSPPSSPTASDVVTQPSTPVPSASASYTVKSGDTLYEIASQFGVSVSALKAINGLTSNVIRVDQILLIP
ncbi:MAG: LysM peptidoglycan-binding domain-containing protein [Chloroflexi bacterium]|nr:LysM peptidoglycan-binding domain-containing protein [Chloroflexota bacterium]